MKNAVLHLNWPMVLAATVAYFAVGAIWYTVLFGKYWARANKMDMNDRSGMARTMVFGFLLTFVICTFIGLLINALHGCKMWDCFFIRSYILVGGLVVGFVGTALNYQRKPLGLWFIDIGYHLVALIPACAILSKWGMTYRGG